jgi:hypothetical protein
MLATLGMFLKVAQRKRGFGPLVKAKCSLAGLIRRTQEHFVGRHVPIA